MSTITQLINNNFGGIRRKETYFSAEKITCSDCQNVELFYTGLNSGVGIRTSLGNIAVSKITVDEDEIVSIIPAGEEIIKVFETIQDTTAFTIVYTESLTEGRLYCIDVPSKTLIELVSGLSVTGKACGCDFVQGWLDMFIFSNGQEIKYIYSNTETHERLVVEDEQNLHLTDTENRTVKGLGLINFDSRLWIFDGRVLWYSKQGECRDFNFNDPDLVTSAGYIEFVKNITAIYPYLGSLAVFHNDSSVLVKTDSKTGFSLDEESPGGCASYNSLVFHGTDLYFYDDTKKGVFSFQQIVNGDKTLGDNIAYDIQEELMKISGYDVHKIRTLSVVTEDRNEVWFLIPISEDNIHSHIMIFDYIRQEWIKRKCQKINDIAVINNSLYSAGKDLYEEYRETNYDGEFIESYFKCSIFNFGADNTLKITKFPPRLTVEGNKKCHFYVKYVKNYNVLKTPKIKLITSKQIASLSYYDSGFRFDSNYIYLPKNINAVVKIPSVTFKALEITFYTTNENEEFAIKAIEFSKIKVKQV